MYKATNIDTDKALEALNESREYQAKASQIRMEKKDHTWKGCIKDLILQKVFSSVQIMKRRNKKQLIQMVSARYSMNLEKNLIYQLRI